MIGEQSAVRLVRAAARRNDAGLTWTVGVLMAGYGLSSSAVAALQALTTGADAALARVAGEVLATRLVNQGPLRPPPAGAVDADKLVRAYLGSGESAADAQRVSELTTADPDRLADALATALERTRRGLRRRSRTARLQALLTALTAGWYPMNSWIADGWVPGGGTSAGDDVAPGIGINPPTSGYRHHDGTSYHQNFQPQHAPPPAPRSARSFWPHFGSGARNSGPPGAHHTPRPSQPGMGFGRGDGPGVAPPPAGFAPPPATQGPFFEPMPWGTDVAPPQPSSAEREAERTLPPSGLHYPDAADARTGPIPPPPPPPRPSSAEREAERTMPPAWPPVCRNRLADRTNSATAATRCRRSGTADGAAGCAVSSSDLTADRPDTVHRRTAPARRRRAGTRE